MLHRLNIIVFSFKSFKTNFCYQNQFAGSGWHKMRVKIPHYENIFQIQKKKKSEENIWNGWENFTECHYDCHQAERHTVCQNVY